MKIQSLEAMINTVTVALQFFRIVVFFVHLSLLELRLMFLGLRGKWFGWCKEGLECEFKV